NAGSHRLTGGLVTVTAVGGNARRRFIRGLAAEARPVRDCAGGKPLLEGHWQNLRDSAGLVCPGLCLRRIRLREPQQAPQPRPVAKRLYGPDLIRRGADYRWAFSERAERSTPGTAGFGAAASRHAAQPGAGLSGVGGRSVLGDLCAGGAVIARTRVPKSPGCADRLL